MSLVFVPATYHRLSAYTLTLPLSSVVPSYPSTIPPYQPTIPATFFPIYHPLYLLKSIFLFLPKYYTYLHASLSFYPLCVYLTNQQ